MTSKRILGYIFIILAVVLTFCILGQLLELIKVIFGIFRIFSGTLDSFQIGEAIGHGVYWIIHFALTIALWKYGLRWSKKRVTVL